MAAFWCPACGSDHEKPGDCPGDLRATGPERHGWRVAVETPHGIEAYGVLVAPSTDRWRARIVTYPNILWTIPGGSRTLKFVGASPQDAEARAVGFVEGHIKARGYRRRDALDGPTVGRIRAEARALANVGPARRKQRSLPIRFGSGPSLFTAMTGNVSESGMFVATLAPLDSGVALRVLVDLETGPVGLKGEVIWSRERIVLGRPVGMGVQLLAPPEAYREFVRELP
ncbi:MAG TPA: PilZ domain-containing protein [Candidatus Polarisedimenticolaceae bacterium]|nr:PilZ domain-containing protein [Candidatus Polarisedimenticolaceae bacterium]